jgi:hypothetical protein
MKNRNVLVGGACVLAVVAAVAIWAVAGGGDEQPGRPAGLVGQPVNQTVSQPAMVTHIDPVTGERTTVPAGDAAAQLGDRVDTSDEGLVEKPSPVPGGGMMIELDGRFQNAAVVSADSDSVKAECVPAEQAAGGGER